MRKMLSLIAACALTAVMFSCTETTEVSPTEDQIPNSVLATLQDMGFNTTNFGVIATEGGYIVENDIFVSDAQVAAGIPVGVSSLTEEHYATNNLVTGLPRVITVYLPTGRRGFTAAEEAALNLAISRYNALSMDISFQRTSDSRNADITFARLSKRDERRGVLGSAGFPTNSGDPFGTIRMSGILESSFGLSTGGIATIFAHEMGHCIGLRHTDYFDRSFSCGGAPSNEGDAGIGANFIPGTPSGAEAGSYMLACTDGSDRPFTSGDVTALTTLY